MKWRVLVSAPYFLLALDEYRERMTADGIELVVPPVRERLSEAELLQWVRDVDGVLCGDDQFTARVLRKAKRLKVISKWGTGIDSIDRSTATRLGIAVYNTPGAFTDPVADTVLGYMLCFARLIPWMHQDVRRGIWAKRPSRSMGECTLGVIGVGAIGKAVIRRAVTFGMRVLGNDIVSIPEQLVAETGLEVATKDTLLEQSDFVSLSCDRNPSSSHLMGPREFGKMRPTAVLINTSRGQVVDERALVAALEQGQIAGAALDVFEVEPLPKRSPLRRFDRVLLGAHNANSSEVAWRKVHESTLTNLLRGLKESGKLPSN